VLDIMRRYFQVHLEESLTLLKEAEREETECILMTTVCT